MRENITQLSLFSNSTLANEVIAITGTLPVLRKDVIELIRLSGGQYRTSVSGQTTILVVGQFNHLPSDDGLTRKLRAAKERIAGGQNITIMSFDELRDIVGCDNRNTRSVGIEIKH